jgi:subtilisin family serine protease
VVFGSGNSGGFDARPDDPDVIVVSATDQDDCPAVFSVSGNLVDLSAPGVSIPATLSPILSPNKYGSGSGTSASAPVVSAVAALVLSVNPGLDAAMVEMILTLSSDDLGPAGWDVEYGHGRVNAERAVAMAVPDPLEEVK